MICGCGCGRETPLAQRTDPRRGHVRGEPLRFCAGHRRRDGVKVPVPEVKRQRPYVPRDPEAGPRTPEKNVALVRAWRAQNPEKRREQARRLEARRRARKRGAAAEYVDSLVLLELHDGVCGICGEDVDPLAFEVDHVVPLARGGAHSYANTQPAHPVCNRRKGAG